MRYSIEPPRLLAEYQRLMKEKDGKKQRSDKDHLEKVVAQFEERKTWWRTEFKPDPVKDKPVVPAGQESRAAAAEALARAPGDAGGGMAGRAVSSDPPAMRVGARRSAAAAGRRGRPRPGARSLRHGRPEALDA